MRWFRSLPQRLLGRPRESTAPPSPSTLPRRPFLIVDSHRQIALTSTCVRIGRAHDNDIVLDDPRVSRHHLELRWQADQARFLAVDLNSSGGTLLNGHPIQQCPLEAGDVLLLSGSIELIYGEQEHADSG
jgi:pSer/pThr/pTyr-binding forkhead associated (FHA) protein